MLLLLLLLWRRRREWRGKIQRRRGLDRHLGLRVRGPGALHRLHGCRELHEGRLLLGLLTLLLGSEPGGRAERRHGRRVLLVHGHGGGRGGRRRQVGLVKISGCCCGGGREVGRGTGRAREAAGCHGRGRPRRVGRLLLLLRGLLIMMLVVVVGVNHVP